MLGGELGGVTRKRCQIATLNQAVEFAQAMLVARFTNRDQGKVAFLQRAAVKLDDLFQKLSRYLAGVCGLSEKFACFLAHALLLWRLSSLLLSFRRELVR